MFELIRSDYRRYLAASGGRAHPLGVISLTQGFWASVVFRFAHAVYTSKKIPGLWQIAWVLTLFMQKGIEVVTGICLPGECEIGPGLYIGHFGQIIVNGRVRIGANCNLSQGVTLGGLQSGEYQGTPVIGDRVYIGPNAIVIGKIEIGQDAVIGAGAVVTRDVPARAVAAGNPAKILSHKGSFDLVRYDGMDKDEDRAASRALIEEELAS